MIQKPGGAAVDLIIPVLNEARVLEASVKTVREFLLRKAAFRWRILIVDNGSTDGTWDIARGLAEAHGDVEAMHLNVKGRGRALREAWQASGADVVVYIDVDLSPELAALPKLVDALLRDGYDLATGSRLLKDSATTRSLKREIISRGYNLFLRCVLSTKFSDAQCGFKAVTRRVVESLVPQVRDQGWFFDTELLVLAEKQGYKIKDVPITWIEDDDSRVKIIPTAWKNILGIFRLRRSLSRARRTSIASRDAERR